MSMVLVHNEIIESYINGNKSDVAKDIKKMSKSELVVFIGNWMQTTGDEPLEILERVYNLLER